MKHFFNNASRPRPGPPWQVVNSVASRAAKVAVAAAERRDDQKVES